MNTSPKDVKGDNTDPGYMASRCAVHVHIYPEVLNSTCVRYQRRPEHKRYSIWCPLKVYEEDVRIRPLDDNA